MRIQHGSRCQQLHDCKPRFRHSLSMRLRAVHSRCAVAFTSCPVVVESEAFSTFAANDLRVRDRATVWALVFIGLAPCHVVRRILEFEGKRKKEGLKRFGKKRET